MNHHVDAVVPTLDRDVHLEADGTAVRVANELQRYSPYFESNAQDLWIGLRDATRRAYLPE
ncbi:hypothetical protein [Streptomyces sp. NPDC003996]